jgi:hypothetical protein
LGANKAIGRARKEPARTHVATAAASAAVYQPQVVTNTPDHVTFTGTDSGVEPNDGPRDDTPVDPRVVGATPTYNATPIEVAPVEVTPIDATPVEVTPIEIATTAVVAETYSEVSDAELSDADVSDADHSSLARRGRTRGFDAEVSRVASAQAAVSEPEASEAPAAKPAAAKKPSVPPKASSRGGHGDSNGKKRAAAAVPDATTKEKVAPSGEAAKTLARSGSGGSKKRSGARADTSKKK